MSSHLRARLPAMTVSLLLAISSDAIAAEAGGGRGAPRIRLTPLCVAPRDDPGSQLVKVDIAGAPVEGPLETLVTLGDASPVAAPCRPAADLPGACVISIPGIERETEAVVSVPSLGPDASARIRLRPLRRFRLFLVQHSHTDIGYTDHPSRLNVDHVRFIDDALRACLLTDGHPDPARFRWTCEGTWAVERYLRERPPERRAEFLRRVYEGRIEVTAMSMNMTDLASPEVVTRALYPVRRLRAAGIPIRSAMQCDVNGYPWMLPELLADLGITGFAGGINHTRSTLPFVSPGALAWESPAGASVLAWRGEHYMFANMLGFRESVAKVLEKLPGYLVSLEKRGYPHDIALLQMAGYFTDNAAPSHRASDLVKEWNERFAAPEVRLATLSEFFDALRAADHPPPVLRQAWPDWWADGVGSAPLEASVIRAAQERLGFAEAFLGLARAARPDAPDPRGTFDEAYRLATLFDEHTFGAAESISSPGSINSKTQWAEKAMHAHRASWLAAELQGAALAAWAEDAIPRGELGIVIFNGLAWERSGPVHLRLPRSIVEEGTPFRIIDPETNGEVPCQPAGEAPNHRDFEIVAHAVPSLGIRTYRLEVGTPPTPSPEVFGGGGREVSNGLVRVELDPARAAIAAIRIPGRENLVDDRAEHAFNQYIHEAIVHEKGRWHLWPPGAHDARSFETAAAREANLDAGVSGPVRRSLRLAARVPSAHGEITVETEVSLYRGLRGVYIENRVTRPGSTDPEAGYFAFPFAAPGPPLADVAGGVMAPGRDQIPGSASDWHAIQRWVRFPGGERDAVLAIVDAPLVQFGGLNTGRWGKGLRLERPLVYSWVTNNYWFTNFLASQSGAFSFRYAVTGGEAAATDATADRFAREVCSPLEAIAAAGRGESPPRRRSFLSVEPPEVDVVALKEADSEPGSLVVRLRNRSDGPMNAIVRLDDSIEMSSAVLASLVEEPRERVALVDGAARIDLGPRGLATLILGREAP